MNNQNSLAQAHQVPVELVMMPLEPTEAMYERAKAFTPSARAFFRQQYRAAVEVALELAQSRPETNVDSLGQVHTATPIDLTGAAPVIAQAAVEKAQEGVHEVFLPEDLHDSLPVALTDAIADRPLVRFRLVDGLPDELGLSARYWQLSADQQGTGIDYVVKRLQELEESHARAIETAPHMTFEASGDAGLDEAWGEQERRAFEAGCKPRTDLGRRRGNYSNPVVQASWETWLRARMATKSGPTEGGLPGVTDRLTLEKARHIAARDAFDYTGFVLTDEEGRVCLVNMSAVRWLDKDEFWKVMHPDSR